MNEVPPTGCNGSPAEQAEPPRSVAEITAGAAVVNAADGGVGIHRAVEAHQRMPRLGLENVDTPSFQGYVFEQQAQAAQNLRHPLRRWKLNAACNEAAFDATAADGSKLQMKKGYGQSDDPSTPSHQRGRQMNNRLIQERALRKLDQHGQDTGKVVTTNGDIGSADPRVIESPVSRARVERATERYAQALEGLSSKDLARLAGQGAKRGALVGGGVSAGFALYGLVTGKLEWDEAAEQVLIGTGAAALGGAVGNLTTGALEALAAKAGDGAAVAAPRIGRVVGRAGIVGVVVCGVTNLAVNGVAVVKGDKTIEDALRDTAKGSACGAAGVVVGAGVATVGAVAASPALLTSLIVVGASTTASLLAEKGFDHARNRLFGDPRDSALLVLADAEAELIEAVAEYEEVPVADLVKRLSLEPSYNEDLRPAS